MELEVSEDPAFCSLPGPLPALLPWATPKCTLLSAQPWVLLPEPTLPLCLGAQAQLQSPSG